MATDLGLPINIHLDYRFLGLQLAPTFSTRVGCVWFGTRLGAAGAAWSAHVRVCGLRVNARRRSMGARTENKVPLCGWIRSSHGPWCRLEHGFKKVTGHRVSGIWGLGLDYGVDDLLGHPVDGCVGLSWNHYR